MWTALRYLATIPPAILLLAFFFSLYTDTFILQHLWLFKPLEACLGRKLIHYFTSCPHIHMLDPSRWSNVPLQGRLVMTAMSGDDKWCQLLQQNTFLLISHSQLRDQSFFLAIITPHVPNIFGYLLQPFMLFTIKKSAFPFNHWCTQYRPTSSLKFLYY